MKILSLYSGGGGIDLGFKRNKFRTILAIENWPTACETLIKNKVSSEVICDDSRRPTLSSFFKIKVLFKKQKKSIRRRRLPYNSKLFFSSRKI